MPALAPQTLIGGRQANTVFPFSAARQRWYFFARNALWYGLGAIGLKEGDEILPSGAQSWR